MKKLIFTLLLTLFFIPSVNAELIYERENIVLLNRSYTEFPFETWYAPDENTNYNNTNFIELSDSSIVGVGMLPKYFYTISCNTGGLDLNTTSISKGKIIYQGSVWGSSGCKVGNYSGQYVLNKWLIDQWQYYTDSVGGHVYGVKWSINIHNTASYNKHVRFESAFLSNELITDFSNEYLLNLLINQNSSLRNELNEVKTNTSETNQKVDDLNQNITNDNVGGVEDSFNSFEGFVAENSTITQLITMPITLYTSILNGVQSTCRPFVIGDLFGTSLTIPCINIGNYLGTALWSMIDIIISGFAIFAISKKLIKIFNNFSSMKEGDVIDD